MVSIYCLAQRSCSWKTVVWLTLDMLSFQCPENLRNFLQVDTHIVDEVLVWRGAQSYFPGDTDDTQGFHHHTMLEHTLWVVHNDGFEKCAELHKEVDFDLLGLLCPSWPKLDCLGLDGGPTNQEIMQT